MNKFIVLGLLIFLLLGCISTQEPTASEQQTVSDQPEESADQIEETRDDDPGEVPADTPDQEAPAELSPETIEEPPAEELTPTEEPAETDEVDQGEVEEYVPTQETYDRTFIEVEETISRLNEIIRERDFEEWKSYLTENYIRTMSSPQMLEELSSHRILQRNNIVLKSLADYFRFVVVPSRANARLDDLVFRNDEQVEAIMIIQGQRVILYQLRKVNDTWKIAIF